MHRHTRNILLVLPLLALFWCAKLHAGKVTFGLTGAGLPLDLTWSDSGGVALSLKGKAQISLGIFSLSYTLTDPELNSTYIYVINRSKGSKELFHLKELGEKITINSTLSAAIAITNMSDHTVVEIDAEKITGISHRGSPPGWLAIVWASIKVGVLGYFTLVLTEMIGVPVIVGSIFLLARTTAFFRKRSGDTG